MYHKQYITLTHEERTALKRYALTHNHPIEFRQVSKTIYNAYEEQNYSLGDNIYKAHIENCNSIHPRYYDVVMSLIRSKQIKAKNIKHKITYQSTLGDVYLHTLTFTDEVLTSTNEETRRKYVQRVLKKHAIHYLANIDFGDEFNREHYHALLNFPIPKDAWPYGFMDVRKIGNDETDAIRLGKYLVKLTNHALKDTTQGRSRFRSIIYSRNFKKGG